MHAQLKGERNARSFGGFDHIDCRVRSLADVERFYDALMPALGFPDKRFCQVDEAGTWNYVSAEQSYNAVEYYERAQSNGAGHFIGFIEHNDHNPGLTRIAFRADRKRIFELMALLPEIGARNVECSEDMERYAAVFFEDAGGTKLEIVSRER